MESIEARAEGDARNAVGLAEQMRKKLPSSVRLHAAARPPNVLIIDAVMPEEESSRWLRLHGVPAKNILPARAR